MAVCSFVFLLAGVVATYWVSIAKYGSQEVMGNGVTFLWVLILAVVIGLGLAVLGIPLGILLTKRIRWFQVSNKDDVSVSS